MSSTFKINSQESSKQQVSISAMKNQYLSVTTDILQSTYAPVQNIHRLSARLAGKRQSFNRKIWRSVVVVVVFFSNRRTIIVVVEEK